MNQISPQSNDNNPRFAYKARNRLDEKFEYDLSEDQVPIIEEITGTKIDYNIGSGGFSVVKLVHSLSQDKYYALKVVIIKFFYFRRLTFTIRNSKRNQK